MPQIQHNALSRDEMYNLMVYLVSILRSMQAASDDIDTNEWWSECCQRMMCPGDCREYKMNIKH